MIDNTPTPIAEEDRIGSTNFSAPRRELEQLLARIWADILALEHVGVHDDFFEIGGHSQMLVRLQIKLRDVLNIDVPVTALFEYRTIDSLAKYLEPEEIR